MLLIGTHKYLCLIKSKITTQYNLSTLCISQHRISKINRTEQHCAIATEIPLILAIEGIGTRTIMCSPCDKRALAIGNLFTEGIIRTIDDIDKIIFPENQDEIIQILFTNLERDAQRNIISIRLTGTIL